MININKCLKNYQYKAKQMMGINSGKNSNSWRKNQQFKKVVFQSFGGYNEVDGCVQNGLVSINMQGSIYQREEFVLSANHYSPTIYSHCS